MAWKATWLHSSPTKLNSRKKWADLFEEAEEAPQAIVQVGPCSHSAEAWGFSLPRCQESSAVEVEAPGEEPHSEA